MSNKVFIVGTCFRNSIVDLFTAYGYDLVDRLDQAGIVCYAGGADINPALYGQQKHHTTYFNDAQDQRELEYVQKAEDLGLLQVGICRGGQLLNAYSGGTMWQDVNNHHTDHLATDFKLDYGVLSLSSIHHQMMRPADNAEILCAAQVATRKEDDVEVWLAGNIKLEPAYYLDIEACYYESTRSLCFQPHPEVSGPKTACADYFMDLIEVYQKEG